MESLVAFIPLVYELSTEYSHTPKYSRYVDVEKKKAWKML